MRFFLTTTALIDEICQTTGQRFVSKWTNKSDTYTYVQSVNAIARQQQWLNHINQHIHITNQYEAQAL